MNYKTYICPNCKYKTTKTPYKKISGRYICPSCNSGAGMKIQSTPGFKTNQRKEFDPVERIF